MQGRKLISWLSRAPFAILGGLTLGLFAVEESLGTAAHGTALGLLLTGAVRFLIIPMWLTRTLVVAALVLIAGGDPRAIPQWLATATLPLVLAPYILGDLLLSHWRRKVAATAGADPR